MNIQIPKIIHQVWINDTHLDNPKREIPDNWKISVSEWKRLHPDWEYILWTDEKVWNYLESMRPEFIDLYKNYEYLIQRADMIRYLILYDYGGIYSDLDFYPTTNFEKFLDKKIDYFIFSSHSDSFQNSLMITQKHSAIMREIMDNLVSEYPIWAVGKHIKVMVTTGPIFLTKILHSVNHPYIILPKTKFNPYNPITEEYKELKKDVYIHALEGNSWHSLDSTIYNIIYRNRVILIILGILFIFCMIVGFFYFLSKYKKEKKLKESCQEQCKLSGISLKSNDD
jgi:mannosyltransferase OCH1-like enzyme